MNSVLLIGQSDFTTGVRSQVRGLNSLSVTTALPGDHLSALVETITPDVVVIQCSTLVQRSIVKTLGQGHSAYFIVVEDSCSPDDGAAQSQFSASGQSSAAKHSEQAQMHQLEAAAMALESGADAYLHLIPKKPAPERQLTHSDRSTHTKTFVQAQSSLSLVFHPSQCRLIQAHIQIGLNRAQRYHDLSRINDWLSAVALVDALTQINNRRAFDLELPNQIKMARKKGNHLSLMVLDIDYFKSVNDRFGHLVGDEVLKQLAKRLLTNMRFYDTPFRYGGEEFVVTLSNTDACEGMAIANRLRESIAREPFELLQPVSNQSALTLTVSIGVTELAPDDDIEGSAFLNRADQNLLKAKSLGRNCVIGP